MGSLERRHACIDAWLPYLHENSWHKPICRNHPFLDVHKVHAPDRSFVRAVRAPLRIRRVVFLLPGAYFLLSKDIMGKDLRI